MTKRLRPPQPVLEIASRLERAGFETWCVGGAVRDALLGHPHLDWDLATAATPREIQRTFRRTVPVGVEFGTVGVLDGEGTMHEVTTFRRDVRTDGRHAVVEFGASLDDDLARRDFTINAIAWSPKREELRDPFGGLADLDARVVRAVGDARERMREDRLRALRAIRFAARLGFTIEDATWRAIVESAPWLGRLSPERVKQELEKTMDQVARPSRAFALWRDAGAFATLVPALASVSDRDLAAIDHAATPREGPREIDRRLTRLALLFLPIGARHADTTLRALRFSKADAAWIAGIVERWEALGAAMSAALSDGDPSPATVRRWVARAGRTRVRSLLRVAAARWTAAREAGEPAPSPAAVARLVRRAIGSAFSDPIEVGDLALDGEDLRRAGIAPGPVLGKILQALLERVLEDPARNVPELLVARALELREEWAGNANGGPDRGR
ncbi:MAG TPA: CCA tRNA nucleotidyltransferase [Gemmatimonadaceae bacterium]|nr:CCA tRNA nucleotidyltransferase [Gemmatimonadaceae bacterium]